MNNEMSKLVQVKRGSNGRMIRYTPPVKMVEAVPVKISAKEFLQALRDASKVIPGADRDAASTARKVAEKAAIEAFLGIQGYDSSKLHAPQVDSAKRKAQFAVRG